MENKKPAGAQAIKTQIIKKRSDFLLLSRYGQRLKVCDWLVLNYEWREAEAKAPTLYVGWTVPKKVGNAVLRNKLKRWARAFFKNQEFSEDKALYINLVFREQKNESFKKITHQEFKDQLSAGWRNISNRRKKAFDGDRSRI